MKISEIKKMDTSIGPETASSPMPGNVQRTPRGLLCSAIHESVFRAYHTLEKVKEYLRLNVPPQVILEIIEVIEDNPADPEQE